MTPSPNARAIALYLPQFHPIPENDEWWGVGFTEWTNTAKARPRFSGHYQPHVPADLGFYDLRVPETRAAQAAMARDHGIEAFCYYHYWFAGKRILERPFTEVVASGQPDFPFCLCWANQTWSGIWHGLTDRVLIEQTYPGDDDHRRHFETLLPAFLDPRYLRVDGKPLFVLFRPYDLPEAPRVLDLWRSWAVAAGLPGIYFAGEHTSPSWDPRVFGLDAVLNLHLPVKRRGWVPWRHPITKIRERYARWREWPMIHDYAEAVNAVSFDPIDGIERMLCVIPNWDNTPRSGANGLVLHGSTPALFAAHVRRTLQQIAGQSADRRILFIKSWNEWAEGNHLEPDLRFGRQYLEALRAELFAPSEGPRR